MKQNSKLLLLLLCPFFALSANAAPPTTPPVIAANQTITVEAEDYNAGGKGVAYFDRHTPSSGADYRTDYDGAYILHESWGYDLQDMGSDWRDYKIGEYVNTTDTTDLTISKAMAVKNWGCWFKYTVEAATDMVVAIKMCTGAHWGSYGTISAIGSDLGLAATTRATGGYRIEGNPTLNWVQRYSASLVLTLDDADLATTQKSHPVCASDVNILTDATKWTANPTEKNDTLWVYPNPSNPNTWEPYFRDGNDYENVILTKGTHTFTVTSLASQWNFDKFTIAYVKAYTGVNNVNADNVKVYAANGAIYVSAPAKVYNLTGQFIGNTSSSIEVPAGVYVVKVGSKAKKVFVK